MTRLGHGGSPDVTTVLVRARDSRLNGPVACWTMAARDGRADGGDQIQEKDLVEMVTEVVLEELRAEANRDDIDAPG